MWNDPSPVWRKAQKQHQCDGDGCENVIDKGELYLDQALRQPMHAHKRYCNDCGEAAEATKFLDGRHNPFPDQYQQHIASGQWQNLRRRVKQERGNRCERCGAENVSLALHHKHYGTLGNERSQDVEVLCQECHFKEHEKEHEVADSGPERPMGGIIIGDGGEHWRPFEPNEIYVPLSDGRYVLVKRTRMGTPEREGGMELLEAARLVRELSGSVEKLLAALDAQSAEEVIQHCKRIRPLLQGRFGNVGEKVTKISTAAKSFTKVTVDDADTKEKLIRAFEEMKIAFDTHKGV
ncbi:MAG: hypothetical protein KF748_01375 [Xanthobacteraceae bacterium]|nr:hypothetical protein [Xanthobacteraceae bacterium]